MPNEAGEISGIIQEQGVNLTSKEEVFAKYRDSVLLESSIGERTIQTITGFDGPRDLRRQTHRFIVLSPELVSDGLTIKGRDGSVLEISDDEGCLSVDPQQIETIAVAGRQYKLRSDPWENLIFLETKLPTVEKEFKFALERVTRLWEAALAGEKNLDQFLEANMDKDTLAEVKDTLKYLKDHPQLQRSFYNLRLIDPWQMAELPLEESRRHYLEKLHISFSFYDSEEYSSLIRIVDKIKSKQNFTAEEINFLNSLALAETAVSSCSRSFSEFF